MSKTSSISSSEMVATKSKHKAISCSTPEHRSESPSRDSDSLSETASPVPFLCTQDGAEGETDVVWNFYTPKSEHAPASRIKNSTPLSTKSKKHAKFKLIEKPVPKRRTIRPSQKNTEIFQDLIELNQNLHELIAKKSNQVVEKPQSGSEEDIFSDSGDHSPKSGLRTSSRCLRRNVLSSKFAKPETETALESDDSMNECLIKASQVVEEKILNKETIPAKRKCYETSRSRNSFKPEINFNIDNVSMDAILNNINLESPLVSKTKKCDSPKLTNDSFDTLVGNLNDSILDKLTQMPEKNSSNCNKLNTSNTNWTVKELVVHEGSPSSKLFGRHNSMPESPLVPENKPSTSGMVFGRYNSMPYNNKGDSPIRCTPEEIKRKHQLAREKLLAKRQLPFTTTQHCSQQVLPTQAVDTQVQIVSNKKPSFQARVATKREQTIFKNSTENKTQGLPTSVANANSSKFHANSTTDLKLLIERKRQEALMKLRRRQPQTKP